MTPEIIFGCGAKTGGNYACVHGEQSADRNRSGVIAAGWLDDVQHSLEEVKLPYHVFSSVTPNPAYTEEVMEGAEVYRSGHVTSLSRGAAEALWIAPRVSDCQFCA